MVNKLVKNNFKRIKYRLPYGVGVRVSEDYIDAGFVPINLVIPYGFRVVYAEPYKSRYPVTLNDTLGLMRIGDPQFDHMKLVMERTGI